MEPQAVAEASAGYQTNPVDPELAELYRLVEKIYRGGDPEALRALRQNLQVFIKVTDQAAALARRKARGA